MQQPASKLQTIISKPTQKPRRYQRVKLYLVFIMIMVPLHLLLAIFL